MKRRRVFYGPERPHPLSAQDRLDLAVLQDHRLGAGRARVSLDGARCLLGEWPDQDASLAWWCPWDWRRRVYAIRRPGWVLA